MPTTTMTAKMKTQDRRQQVGELILTGKSMRHIASLFGVSAQTIHNDLKAIYKDWVIQTAINFDEAIAREVMKIDHLEREALEAWERSKTPKIRKTKAADGSETTTIENTAGDASFLTAADKFAERRSKLLRLTTPEVSLQVEVNNIVNVLATVLPPDQLNEVIAAMEAQR